MSSTLYDVVRTTDAGTIGGSVTDVLATAATGPQGVPGPPGEPGTVYDERGIYSASVQYLVDDIVVTDGNTYVCIVEPPGPGHVPAAGSPYFKLFVRQGQPGPQGAPADPAALDALDGRLDTVETTLPTKANASDLTAEVTRATTAEAGLATTVDNLTATDVAFTPTTDIAATNTQAAVAEVAAEAIPRSLFVTQNMALRSGTNGVVQAFPVLSNAVLGRFGSNPISSIQPNGLKSMLAYLASEITVTPTGGLAATTVQAALAELDGDLTAEATARAAAITAAINALINSAPGTLDTLGEIAAALADNDDAVAALTDAINARALQTALDAEVAARTAAVTAERNRAVDAETTLNDDLTNFAYGVQEVYLPAKADLTALTAETARATTAEANLYEGELNRAADALALRLAAEADLQADIDAIDTRVDTLEPTVASTAARFNVPIPDVQLFTASGTWTKPAGNYTLVEVTVIGAGGGGGSGRRGAAGTIRTGGAGGGSGAISLRSLLYSELGSTVAVTVSPGGTGAPGVTTDDTTGINGSVSGSSTTSFAGLVTATRATSGGGGSVAGAAPGGSAGTGLTLGTAGGASAATGGAAPGPATTIGAGHGGGGGGLTAANVASAGSRGGTPVSATGSLGGEPSVAPGGAGPDGAGSTINGVPGGGGAGGASHSAGAAGNGGHGAFPGGGGGGGGASANGFVSGAGGNGGGGCVLVVCR